jgi:CO/xanthine dehydrogenase FAD-binding subunit
MVRGSEPGAGGLGKEASAIGQAQARHDAWAKAAGREKYASDYYPERFLWLGVKRSGQRHARLRGIDTTAAAKVPGVVAVLTHRAVSLCTASPAADSWPALQVSGARVELRSIHRRRVLPLAGLIIGPGQNKLQPGGILWPVRVPLPADGMRSAYFKVGEAHR